MRNRWITVDVSHGHDLSPARFVFCSWEQAVQGVRHNLRCSEQGTLKQSSLEMDLPLTDEDETITEVKQVDHGWGDVNLPLPFPPGAAGGEVMTSCVRSILSLPAT